MCFWIQALCCLQLSSFYFRLLCVLKVFCAPVKILVLVFYFLVVSKGSMVFLWGLHWLNNHSGYCLLSGVNCCDKTLWTTATWGGKAGTWNQQLKQRPWGNAANSFSLHRLLSLHPYTTENHLPVDWVLPHRPLMKKMLHTLTYKQVLRRHFIEPRFPLPRYA